MDPSLEKEMWACQWYVFTIQYDLYIQYKVLVFCSPIIFCIFWEQVSSLRPSQQLEGGVSLGNLQNSDPDNILETLPDIHV